MYTDGNRESITRTLVEKFGWGEWDVELGMASSFRCEYCDRDLLASVDDYDAWQKDHIIPLSRDGETEKENLAVSCKTCNFIKRDYLPLGSTREERIADARRLIQIERATKLKSIAAMRSLVFGGEESIGNAG